MGIAKLPNADEGTESGTEKTDRGRRVFRASDGVVWSVRERAPRGDGIWPGMRSLVFESDMVIRRVRRFPPDWRDLPDDELERLSWRT